MQRIRVDLPEPEGPITTRVSPGLDIERHIVEGAELAERLADPAHADDRGHQRPRRLSRFSSSPTERTKGSSRTT